MSDGTDEIDGLMQCLLAANLAGKQALLEAHEATLLSGEAEAQLEAQAAAAGDDAERRQALAWHLGLIQACRQNGIGPVFRHVEQQVDARDQAKEALEELQALEGDELDVLLRKEALCRQLLAVVERAQRDCRKIGGHAATAAGGCGSLAGWKRCPKPEPSMPL